MSQDTAHHLFVSYSHADRKWLEKLQTHLKGLALHGSPHLDCWDDTRIKAGDRWRDEIETALSRATAAILLLSPDFFASTFIAKDELPQLLEKARSQGLRFFILVLRPCRFGRDPNLGIFQTVHNPDKPLAEMTLSQRDRVLDQLMQALEALPPRITPPAPPDSAQVHISATTTENSYPPVPGQNRTNGAGAPGAPGASVGTPVDLQEIQKRQRKRLRKLKDGFAGKFGTVLWQELDTKFDDLTEGMASSPDAVADCFAKVPAEQAGNLFYALKQACRLTKNLNEAESSLLAELLIHAAMRVVDVSLWCVPELWRNGAPASRACVHALPASSSLLAAVGFAGLHGLTLRMGHGSAPDGVIDLSRMEFDSIVADSVMRALYDEVFKTEARRLNPDEPLTDGRDGKESEVDKLRVRLGELAYNKMVVTIYLRAPALDGQMKQDVLTEVAQTINSRVVLGSSTNDPQLMQAATGVTPGDLLIHVMELLAYTGVASDEVPAPAATADQAVASVRPPPSAPAPAEPEYKYDLFISHASEDKLPFVDGLVEALKINGLNVWYDKEQIGLGDSISARINQGLRESRFGLVVFSQHFLIKPWTGAELESLFAMQLLTGRKRLLPLLHEVTIDQVTAQLPLMADRLSCNTNLGKQEVIRLILNAIR